MTLASVTATSWLDLLLREASAEEIETFRMQRLSEHDDPAAAEAEARRALQLSALLRIGDSGSSSWPHCHVAPHG